MKSILLSCAMLFSASLNAEFSRDALNQELYEAGQGISEDFFKYLREDSHPYLKPAERMDFAIGPFHAFVDWFCETSQEEAERLGKELGVEQGPGIPMVNSFYFCTLNRNSRSLLRSLDKAYSSRDSLFYSTSRSIVIQHQNHLNAVIQNKKEEVRRLAENYLEFNRDASLDYFTTEIQKAWQIHFFQYWHRLSKSEKKNILKSFVSKFQVMIRESSFLRQEDNISPYELSQGGYSWLFAEYFGQFFKPYIVTPSFVDLANYEVRENEDRVFAKPFLEFLQENHPGWQVILIP